MPPWQARRGTPQQHEPLLVYGPPELQSLVLAAIRCVGGAARAGAEGGQPVGQAALQVRARCWLQAGRRPDVGLWGARSPWPLHPPTLLAFLPLPGRRTGNVTLTTPLVVTGLVLDPARARPPSKVDEAGMLQVGGCTGWVGGWVAS